MIQAFDPQKAALGSLVELKEAQRRIDLGEPVSTTAAEIGLTPWELTELFYISQNNSQ